MSEKDSFRDVCISIAMSDDVPEWKRKYYEANAKSLARESQRELSFDDDEGGGAR